ncbi:MAG: hypothetical protein KYX66_22725, partial [Blastomonas fulva]|uniref:hypothetical protein n=1 Tax=Blastomonas fulva TaxID=1550728 RepID=UPI0024E2066B
HHPRLHLFGELAIHLIEFSGRSRMVEPRLDNAQEIWLSNGPCLAHLPVVDALPRHCPAARSRR